MRRITKKMRDPGGPMGPLYLTNRKINNGFESTMKATVSEFKNNPFTAFRLEKINERWQAGMLEAPRAAPVPGSRAPSKSSRAEHTVPAPEWYFQVPTNFEQVKKIQRALLPAIEDYAAWTGEPPPAWKEGQPQTIWGSYYEQHSRLQSLAETVWRMKTGSANERSPVTLRHSMPGDSTPLRHSEARITKMRPRRLPVPASSILKSHRWEKAPASPPLPFVHGPAVVLGSGDSGIGISHTSDVDRPTYAPSPEPEVIDEETLEKFKAANEFNAMVLRQYPSEFSAWLRYEAFEHYDQEANDEIEWVMWREIVAPTVFAKERGLEKLECLPRLPNPLSQRPIPRTVGLKQAITSHQIWKRSKQFKLFAACTCNNPLRTARPEVQEIDIMALWQMSQKEPIWQDRTIFRAENQCSNGVAQSYFEQFLAADGIGI